MVMLMPAESGGGVDICVSEAGEGGRERGVGDGKSKTPTARVGEMESWGTVGVLGDSDVISPRYICKRTIHRYSESECSKVSANSAPTVASLHTTIVAVNLTSYRLDHFLASVCLKLI